MSDDATPAKVRVTDGLGFTNECGAQAACGVYEKLSSEIMLDDEESSE